MEGRAVGHNFERDPSRDHPCQVKFNLVWRFQRRRFKCESLRRMTDGRTDKRTMDAKWWQKLSWPLARWAKNHNKMNMYTLYIFSADSDTTHFQAPWRPVHFFVQERDGLFNSSHIYKKGIYIHKCTCIYNGLNYRCCSSLFCCQSNHLF